MLNCYMNKDVEAITDANVTIRKVRKVVAMTLSIIASLFAVSCLWGNRNIAGFFVMLFFMCSIISFILLNKSLKTLYVNDKNDSFRMIPKDGFGSIGNEISFNSTNIERIYKKIINHESPNRSYGIFMYVTDVGEVGLNAGKFNDDTIDEEIERYVIKFGLKI